MHLSKEINFFVFSPPFRSSACTDQPSTPLRSAKFLHSPSQSVPSSNTFCSQCNCGCLPESPCGHPHFPITAVLAVSSTNFSIIHGQTSLSTCLDLFVHHDLYHVQTSSEYEDLGSHTKISSSRQKISERNGRLNLGKRSQGPEPQSVSQIESFNNIMRYLLQQPLQGYFYQGFGKPRYPVC